MRKILFILLIFSPLFLSGQETKKISRVLADPSFTEVFYVLKSNAIMMHGKYRMEKNGNKMIEGHYQMGERDSIWTLFNKDGKLRSRGRYTKGSKDGIWEYYDDKGELDQKIDYTNNVLLLYKTQFATHNFKILSGDSSFVSKLERPPLYVGGSSRFTDYFAERVTLPLHKPNDNVYGAVYVAFTIDTLGITSSHRVLKGIGRICNEEAVRVIKSIPDDWIPGVLDGKFVNVEYIVIALFDNKTRTMEF